MERDSQIVFIATYIKAVTCFLSQNTTAFIFIKRPIPCCIGILPIIEKLF